VPQQQDAEQSGVGGSGTIETVGEGEDALTVVRLEGTRYEMGYWYGKLLADQIAEARELVEGMVQKSGVPAEMVDMAAQALWNEKHFDTESWGQEFQGVVDGCEAAGRSEVTLDLLKKMAAIPDLSEYNCSLFAAWGKATAGGETYQMRNLDWTMDSGLQNYPVVAVYSPDDGRKHAIVGFAGMMGAAVGGMNEDGLAVSEIMGHFGDAETLDGTPFPVLLRDVLYHDTTLKAALSRMESVTRTNQYHYAIADPNAPDPKARLLLTSNTRFDQYADNQSVDPHPVAGVTPFHESLDDALYWKNHNGKNNAILYKALKDRYGTLDAKGAIEIAQAACVDGTLVSIIYHNSGKEMWVAFAEGMTPAPRQKFVRISLDK
jgi:isopenicillin-N N-acyltransferase like protein